MLYIAKKLMFAIISTFIVAVLIYTYIFDKLSFTNNYTFVNVNETHNDINLINVIKTVANTEFLNTDADMNRIFNNKSKFLTVDSKNQVTAPLEMLQTISSIIENTNKDGFPARIEPLPKEGIYCYKIQENSLQDISEITPIPDKSIFFHETSCNSYVKGKIWLNPRQACAVESAAIMNPNMDVYVLFSSPGILKIEGHESDKILEALLSYDNVNLLHLDYAKYTNNTPIGELYSRGLIEKNEEYAVAHASDMLRFLTLWKYGGIYLDTDVVVLKSLEDLPLNAAGAESDYDISAGMFKFSSSGSGHQMLSDVLEYLKNNFNPDEWSQSSVGAINRIVKTYCRNNMASELFNKTCNNFTVFPQKYFYPIFYGNWEFYFHQKYKDAVLHYSSDSYAIHVWNKLSAHKKILKTKDTAYTYYARQYCPKVFSEIQIIF